MPDFDKGEMHMNITIDEQLRRLRREKGNTQQDLADHLEVSVQAVSKWERGEGCPEITMLPRIGAYYDVTVDELLGVDRIRKEQRIREWTEQIRESLHDRAEALDLCRQAYREMPNEPEIVNLLAVALYDDGLEQNGEELERLAHWLLKHANQSGQYFGAVRVLCHLHAHRGDWAGARKYAAMGGRYAGTDTQLLIHVLEGEAVAALCRANIEMLIHLIAVNTGVMLDKGGLSTRERTRAAELVSGIYGLYGKAAFPAGHCGEGCFSIGALVEV